MADRDSASSLRRRRPATARPDGSTNPFSDLPYTVELWDLQRAQVERVLARAASAILARAIFTAAQGEHIGRRITLKHGEDVIAES